MRLVRSVLFRLLAPRLLLTAAVLCAAAAFLAGYASVHEAASRKLALRQGPPQAVALEDYRSFAHRGPVGEIAVRARTDADLAFMFSLPGTSERAFLVPLFPLEGDRVNEAQGVIFLPVRGEQPPDVSALVTRDPSGWVGVNGLETGAGQFPLMLAGALAAQGRSLAPRPVIIQPFVDGREAALQPATDPRLAWAWLASAALILALAAAFVDVRGVPSTATMARDASRTPVVSTRFAPLPQQEEDGPAGFHAVRRAVQRAAAAGLAASVRTSRAVGALVRLVRAGIGEIRSPR